MMDRVIKKKKVRAIAIPLYLIKSEILDMF